MLDSLCHGFEIRGGDIDVLGNSSGAGVSRRGEQFFYLRALAQFPGDGMLPGAVTDDEDFQASPPKSRLYS
jgi:hypothetical protein